MANTHASFPVTGSDGQKLSAYRWDPAGPPRAIAQIVHGMGEHALRYADVARVLTEGGLVVYAHDHRCHGRNAPAESLGEIGGAGWGHLVDDIGIVGEAARSEQPSLPMVLIAHSMGSFAVQQFLLSNSEPLHAVAMTGTAALDILAPAIDLDAELDLALFNAPFDPARTDFDWLSRDEHQVDAYIADDRCGFGLDPDAVRAMFEAAAAVADPSALDRVRPTLPILLLVGEADPVNGQLQLVHPLVDRYKAAGLTDVTLVTYPDARHEVFNEINREEVYADLLSWIDRVLG